MERESPSAQEKRWLREIHAAVARLATGDYESALAHDQARAAAQDAANASAQVREESLAHELAIAQAQRGATARQVESQHAERRVTIEQARDAQVERIVREVSLAERKAAQEHKEARWLAHSVYEAHSKRLAEQARRWQLRLEQHRDAIGALAEQGRAWLQHLGFTPRDGEAMPDAGPVEADRKLADRVAEAQTTVESQLRALCGLRLPRFAQFPGFIGIFVLIAACVAALSHFQLTLSLRNVLISALASAAVFGTALSVWLRTLAKRQALAAYGELRNSVALGAELSKRALQQTAEDARRRKRKLRAQRDADYEKAELAKAEIARECTRRREEDLPNVMRAADAQLLIVDQSLGDASRSLQHEFDARTATAHDRAIAADAAQQSALAGQLALADARREQARAEGLLAWNQTLASSEAELAALRAKLNATCPTWESLPAALPALKAFPRGVRIGQLQGSWTQQLDPWYAERARPMLPGAPFLLPATLDFPQAASFLVKSDVAGRDMAVRLLQTAMLRLLTGLPPGKVRFTIIDPAGLGDNFASFMHLADCDELLVNHRIWTEPAQIERKLAEVTEHMETVIQKYLRNEFATIHDYNAQAGEIAEPLRVVVVAGFPASFTESAARRLASIAANGPRCGVHVLLSADMRQPKGAHIDLAEMERHTRVLHCEGNKITWQEEGFRDLEFTLDEAPAELLKPILLAAGQAAVSVRRVEVPFEAIAPAEQDVWKSDSRRVIDVPLGRTGATRLQSLRLGEGTSQHVLIAGKTGSGKSTLLHALITNAALRYAPSDLQLYLIDFKKGVEFKSYVTRKLPHARVVAIESEREFGLSVMQRLDAEMRRRGELFRALGVQDIAAYRDAGHALPRILFVVDEFQEFFVQDDKIAQEAALLLDRLVRQGRAFGMHVILGSQTLSGAYSLARSTLGQMAVRIALQCNESDAQVILSEDNTAARMLSRPGEAIYNDANGRVEGNHLFQVVWASDERREHHLAQLAERAEANGVPLVPQIVFEGSQPAEVSECAAVERMLSATIAENSQPRLWLGEPLAIDEATNVTFARRGGANLLCVGQNERAVGAMITTSLVSLFAQSAVDELDSSPQCVLLHSGALDDGFSASLKALSDFFPKRLTAHAVGECADVLASFTAELERRRQGSASHAPRLLVLHDLARLRPLRRREDDFGFGRQESGPRPDQQLAELLREGPAVGLHVLAWCDTLANLNRTLDRPLLKEFDARVLLQMSAADSSLLTDTAAASQLGPHRALLQREDFGVLEKFRPFSQPGKEWIEQACQAISQRASVERTAALA